MQARVPAQCSRAPAHTGRLKLQQTHLARHVAGVQHVRGRVMGADQRVARACGTQLHATSRLLLLSGEGAQPHSQPAAGESVCLCMRLN